MTTAEHPAVGHAAVLAWWSETVKPRTRQAETLWHQDDAHGRLLAEQAGALASEYAEVAERVGQLGIALAAATRERNAVLAAMAEAGLTYAQMTEITGMPAWRIRTALHNDWLANRHD